MSNLLTGLIGMLMLLIFLGFYAVKLNTPPLWVIIVGVLLLALYDFAQSLRSGDDDVPR